MLVPAASLLDLSRLIFEACGSPRDEAAIVAKHLVEANLMGMDSHGVIRVPQYVRDIQSGAIVPGAPVRSLKKTPTAAVIDGGWNFGQVAMLRATEVAIGRAKRVGIGCAILRRCRHVGCLGMYPLEAAKQDCVSLAMCGSAGEGLRVCPPGGREGRLATNPIAFAAPTSEEPVLLDFATSMSSEGKIRVALNCNERLPDGWIIDGQGNPSNDPKDLYGPPRGAILPIGGSQGYKGFALSLMVQIMSGLIGIPTWREDGLEAAANVTWLMCMDIESMMSSSDFHRELEELIAFVKSSAVTDGSSEVIMPGELNFREMKIRSARGVPVDDETWRQIAQVAGELQVDLHPSWEMQEAHNEAQ